MSLSWETTPASAFSAAPANIPTLPTLSLSDDETAVIQRLDLEGQPDRNDIQVEDDFYRAEMLVPNLGISIPDELWSRLKVVLGWGRVAVDPYVDRLSCEGFRLPGGTDVDARLGAIWEANGLAREQSLAFTDALVMRRAYWLVGSDPDGSDIPRITVESPLNVSVLWDGTGRNVIAARQNYTQGSEERQAVLLPNQTIQLAKDSFGRWSVADRDEHGFGRVPIIRMANNPRTNNRAGQSQITPDLRSLIVMGCQREIELGIASNLYSTPRILLLGAALSDFIDSGGKAINAWKSYISLINVLERDEEGQVPEVRQLQTYDPSTYTKVVDHLASQAAGAMSAVPQELGLYTSGNPTSVESFQAMEWSRDLKARKKKRDFGVDLSDVMKMSVRFMNKGVLPPEFSRIATDWADIELQSTAAVTDSMQKQIAAGSIPATSDVTLKRLGYSAVERAQLGLDRGEQVSGDIVAELRNVAASARAPQQQVAPQQVTGDAGVQS